MRLPWDASPDRLHNLVLDLVDLVPVRSGLAGYTIRSTESEVSQRCALGWLHRFFGLGLPDEHEQLCDWLKYVKGAGWLTILGHSIADVLSIGDIHGLVSEQRKHGVVLRAGWVPTLGEMGTGFPTGTAKIAKLLAPLMPKPEAGLASAHLHRFIKPYRYLHETSETDRRMFSCSAALWRSIPAAEGQQRFSLDGFLQDVLDDMVVERVTSYRLHTGTLKTEGPLVLGATAYDDRTVHVIDGDLHVDGPLVYNQSDYYGVLYVTGDLVCTHALISSDAMLFVGGTLKASGLVATNLSDAAHLMGNALEAKAWVATRNRAEIRFTTPPRARFVRCGSLAPAKDPEGSEPDFYRFPLHDAVPAVDVVRSSLLDDTGQVQIPAIRRAMTRGGILFA